MAKRFSVEYKKSLCEEFLASDLTRVLFCKNKNIGFSTLSRWLKTHNARDESRDAFQPLRTKYVEGVNCVADKMLQMILPNGIKINLPPQFCSSDLNSLLSALVSHHA